MPDDGWALVAAWDVRSREVAVRVALPQERGVAQVLLPGQGEGQGEQPQQDAAAWDVEEHEERGEPQRQVVAQVLLPGRVVVAQGGEPPGVEPQPWGLASKHLRCPTRSS